MGNLSTFKEAMYNSLLEQEEDINHGKIYFKQAVCCHTWVIQTEGMEEESVSKSFVVNWQFVQLEMQ
jgi:hypothetical protein